MVVTCLVVMTIPAGCGSSGQSTVTARQTASRVSTAHLARKVFPAGRVPTGWKVYRGSQVPIVVAYPPHWSVDESNASVGEVAFASKTGSASGTIGKRSTLSGSTALAVLRTRFLSFVTRVCEAGKVIESANNVYVSGTRFATLIAKCASEEEGAGKHEHAPTFYIGVSRKSGVEWTFSFRSDNDEFAANQRRYFVPILRTLNIYANH